jgi:hypothetical protein
MRKLGLVVSVCLLVAVGSSVMSCAKKESASTNATSDLSGKLAAISDKFVPKSLDYSGGSAAMAVGVNATATAQNINPCVGYDLFGCQPVLLRVYISLAKMFFDMTRTVVDTLGVQLGSLADGSSGTVTTPEGTITYNKVSATEYSILMKKDGNPFSFISVNGSSATVKMDFTQSGNPEDRGSFETTVVYTDSDTWTVNALFRNENCDTDDARAPEMINVLIAKSGAVWTGKSMMYNPRWVGDVACTDTPTDGSSMNFYTDFVGDDAAAKVSVFLMQRDKSTLADISDFAMKNLCTKYNFCGDPAPDLSAYNNPFCNPDTTDVAVWDNSCGSYSTAVSAADFGPASDWIIPNVFYTKTVSLPDSI